MKPPWEAAWADCASSGHCKGSCGVLHNLNIPFLVLFVKKAQEWATIPATHVGGISFLEDNIS